MGKTFGSQFLFLSLLISAAAHAATCAAYRTLASAYTRALNQPNSVTGELTRKALKGTATFTINGSRHELKVKQRRQWSVGTPESFPSGGPRQYTEIEITLDGQELVVPFQDNARGHIKAEGKDVKWAGRKAEAQLTLSTKYSSEFQSAIQGPSVPDANGYLGGMGLHTSLLWRAPSDKSYTSSYPVAKRAGFQNSALVYLTIQANPGLPQSARVYPLMLHFE